MAKKTVATAPKAVETKAPASQIAESPAQSIKLTVGPDMGAGTVGFEVQGARIAILYDAGQESQVLSFRGAEYHLPKQIVAHPLPTLTFRHLQKVTEYAFAGKPEKVGSAVKRAIASAIDTASLVKIACVAHSEGLHADATIALSKAVRCAKKDQALKGIAINVASRLGYDLAG